MATAGALQDAGSHGYVPDELELEPELPWSQCDGFDCVVLVAVVPAFDFELPPPLAARATPAPPRASAVTAVASRAACLGRNTWASFLSRWLLHRTSHP
jgi:hypothetical protein